MFTKDQSDNRKTGIFRFKRFLDILILGAIQLICDTLGGLSTTLILMLLGVETRVLEQE